MNPNESERSPLRADNGAEALIRMLQGYGVTHLFGVCGDTSLPYYDALYRLEHGIEHVLARDERSAAYMADAYARVTGRVGVCEGPSGGGATYLLPGLVEANESSVPVLGFTSDVPVSSRGRYPLTELDQQSLYAPLTKWNSTIDTAAQVGDAVRAAFAPLAASDERPIRPERVVASLRRALAADAIVCADPGTACPYFSAYFDLPQAGRHFITNRAHGALGFALPAALGAWFGRPSSKCVAVMGDGSFGFVAGELETVLRSRAPLLMVVLSNASYGWIKASQRASYGQRYFSVDFTPTDHAAIASAYGIASWRVEDPAQLDDVLRRAIGHEGPALVDIVTQPLELAAAPVSQWMG